MKRKKQFAVCIAAAVGVLVFTGCSHRQSLRLANEIVLSLDDVSDVTISYDEETITFYPSENGDLTIKEYMTEDKSRYYAKVERRGGIKVREGGKPFFQDDFYRCIEVYLPASYRGNLTVTTTDGDIDLSGLEMFLNELRIDSTAGTVRINAVEAQDLYLSTTSGILDADCLSADTIRIAASGGNFFCGKLNGDVVYTTTSGSADIKSAVGSGDYRSDQSGDLRVIYTEVTGDLSFYNKNDDIYVKLPADLEFEFEAVTKNGSVSTSFPECVSDAGGTISGAVGGHPAVSVRVETNNGTIEVEQ